jgi:hypothetical protein
MADALIIAWCRRLRPHLPPEACSAVFFSEDGNSQARGEKAYKGTYYRPTLLTNGVTYPLAKSPQDQFYRHVERTLDLSFVRELVQEKYAGGTPPLMEEDR